VAKGQGTRTLFRRKRDHVEDRSLQKETIPGAFYANEATADQVGTRQAMQLADVFACVRVLAHSAASCPIQVYRKGSGGQEHLETGQTAELLREPMPGVTQASFVMALMSHLVLWNECFIGKYRGPDGTVAELEALPPDRVRVEIIGNRPRYTYTAQDGHVNEHLTLDDVIHVRSVSVDGVRGSSPVGLVREAFGLSKSLTDASAALWRNGGKPSGMFALNEVTEQAEERAKNFAEAWDARHKGPANAGRIAVTLGDMKFVPVSMSFQDAQFVATRQMSTAEIARILGVQPFMVNAETAGSMTYSSVVMQAEAHLRFDLMPRLILIEQAMSNDIDLCPTPSASVKFNADEFLRTDLQTRMAVYRAGIQAGLYTPNEVRAFEDLPPIERETVTQAVKNANEVGEEKKEEIPIE
jgi:HK97 family phage portal protein